MLIKGNHIKSFTGKVRSLTSGRLQKPDRAVEAKDVREPSGDTVTLAATAKKAVRSVAGAMKKAVLGLTPWGRQVGQDVDEKEWTVLVYVNESKDMPMAEASSLGKFVEAGSTRDVNYAGQVARAWDDGKARRVNVPKKKWGDMNPRSEMVEDLPVTNMGSGKTFEEFLRWGAKKYPAKHYMVVMVGHGAGHRGAIPDEIHSDMLKPREIADGLHALREDREGRKLDVLMMDNCLMANGEFGYEIKDEADFLVGSEEVKKNGNDYTLIGKKLNRQAKKGELDGRGVVSIIMGSIRDYGISTFSAVDLKKMGSLGLSVKGLAGAMEKTPNSQREVLNDIGKKTEHYCKDEMLAQEGTSSRGLEHHQQLKDVVDFALRVESDSRITDPALKKAAARVRKSVEESVVENFIAPDNVYKNSHGLSLNISADNRYGPGDDYGGLSFVKDTGWTGQV